ncbi:serine hydrolase [Halorubellus litoreus]|uniref:Serine hydrolase n=1 Tax=Halorubellus litoreus TaxID=755308 RepID=A0ABD5VGI8_9EURY
MGARTDGLPPEMRREVESFLDDQRVTHDIPGLSVAVLDRDDLLLTRGMGARDVESRAPATPDTLYSIASVTKPFTAVAIMQLVDRGDLALDDEIREYVDFWNDVPGDPITVHDLLSHSSGMPDDYAGTRQLLFNDALPTSPLVTRADEIRHANSAADRRITDHDRLMYSNRGYGILGEILETVSDQTHTEYVESNIFEPLGMDRSQVGYGEISETAEDSITGYTIEDGEPVATDHDLQAEMRPPFAAGGILSSVTEVATLVRCLLNDGELDGERLLDADLVAAMASGQAPEVERLGGQRAGYGYGLRVSDFLGERYVDHSGSAPGVSRAYVGYLPQRGIGVTLAVNTTGVPIYAFGKGVLAIVAGEVPESVVPYLSLQAKIDAVTGVYDGYRGSPTMTVRPGNGGHVVLSYRDVPDWDLPAFPASIGHDDYTFHVIRENGVREPVRFRRTESGMELLFNTDRLDRIATEAPKE